MTDNKNTNNNDANIEKFSGKMDKEDSGCTISVNETIQSIKDLSVAGLYIYLLSKPPSWNICIKEIRNHFSLSKDKAYRIINTLLEIRLLESIPIREKGRFTQFRYKLYLKPFPENQELVTHGLNTGLSPVPEKRAPATPEPVNKDAYKTKRNTKQRENNININAREKNSDWDNHQATYEIARSDRKKEISVSILESEKSFNEFWSIYPVKKSHGRAKAAWLSQGCHSFATDILQKLTLQLKKDSQYLDGYSPNPDKYLMEEKWKDEIQIRKKTKGLDTYDRNATGWGDEYQKDLF